MSIEEIRNALIELSNSSNATILQRFFKTGPGQYGEGDRFRGIKVPPIRAVVKKFQTVSHKEVEALLHSPYHEDRLCALLLWVEIFGRSKENVQEEIYTRYLSNTSYINNWDLVDLSSQHIVGRYLFDKNREPLYSLVKSDLLWDRRIAVLATFCFIKKNDFKDLLALAEMLLADREDLMHKAVGWMLREIGKRDLDTERKFLNKHYKKMPRTMLRYAIERFDEPLRLGYLRGTV